MSDATFTCPDLTSFCRLDGLGLEVTGQRIEPDRAILGCRPVEADDWCRDCGGQGFIRGSVVRRLSHVPLGWRPTVLQVRLRRYRCIECGRVWCQDTSAAAEPRSKLSRAALRWGLEGLVVQHLSMSRIAAGLDVAWNTANDAVLAEGQRVLISDPARFDGVKVIGVDEHCWRHTRRGEKYVTVIIDLTPTRDGTGSARLLDMLEGRSKQVFKSWLAARPHGWRDGIEVVAMDGFTGYKTAAVEELHHATAVMDPFHVVRLAGEALTRCRQRVQQDTCGHRGRAGDLLYRARRTLLTGVDLLTDKQVARLEGLFANEQHAEVHATWSIYQRLVVAYRQPDKKLGRFLLDGVIDAISSGVPKELVELISLGRTLHRRAADVLAFFDRPGTSNGPTEAIKCRCRHLMAYADVWIMPTVTTSALVGTGWVGGLSA
nr:ISL3 family transposase [Tessaracoccus bendigoensis]